MLNLEQEQEKERQFICACGKAYFSYAALFTHVKQKHDGKAPGPIIKPKPENKRGRPRKVQAETQSHSATQSPSARKSLSKIQDMPQSNCGYQNEDSKQSKHIFKPKAGSTFKHYQAQKSFMPTVQQLPAMCSFQIELLQDLSRSLQFKFLNSVPEIVLKKMKTYQMIEDGAQHGDVVSCIRSFLNFCKDGVRKQTHSQLVLLMSMLLQHIIVSQKQKLITQLSINDIHKHIISFFEYVTEKYKQIDLSPYDVFNSISTIKSLIVFFNWLNRFQAEQRAKQSNELQHTQKCQ